MIIRAETKPLIVRYRLADEQYSNMIHEATSGPVGRGVFEEYRLSPGLSLQLADDTVVLAVLQAGSSSADIVENSPNGGDA